MAHGDPFAPSTFPKLLASLLAGAAVGAGIVLPTISEDLAAAAIVNPGPVGNALLLGVLGMVGVTVGLFALYQLFILIDR